MLRGLTQERILWLRDNLKPYKFCSLCSGQAAVICEDCLALYCAAHADGMIEKGKECNCIYAW